MTSLQSLALIIVLAGINFTLGAIVSELGKLNQNLREKE